MIGGFKPFAGHAHDGNALAIHEDGSTQDIRITIEASLPETVGDDNGTWPVQLVLLSAERPAHRERHPHDSEERRAHEGTVQQLGTVFPCEGAFRLSVYRHFLEAAGLRAPVDEVGPGDGGGFAFLRGTQNANQAMGIRVGQRP